MKLYWSSRSPFVRKVMVCAHECGLAARIECVRTLVMMTRPNPDLLPVNPLGKIPTLVLDDGSALYDSTVICEYLDSLHGGSRLFPESGPARWTAMEGGFPIIVDGECLGGIGVSGGDWQQDEDIAKAAVAAVGASL